MHDFHFVNTDSFGCSSMPRKARFEPETLTAPVQAQGTDVLLSQWAPFIAAPTANGFIHFILNFISLLISFF